MVIASLAQVLLTIVKSANPIKSAINAMITIFTAYLMEYQYALLAMILLRIAKSVNQLKSVSSA